MNLNAISAVSTLGIFLIGLFSLFKPNIDREIFIPMYVLLLLLIFLVLHHKLFRLIMKQEKGAVYKVSWGIKRWIVNPVTLRRLGHTWDEIDITSGFEFNLHPTGKPINLAKKGEYK